MNSLPAELKAEILKTCNHAGSYAIADKDFNNTPEVQEFYMEALKQQFDIQLFEQSITPKQLYQILCTYKAKVVRDIKFMHIVSQLHSDLSIHYENVLLRLSGLNPPADVRGLFDEATDTFAADKEEAVFELEPDFIPDGEDLNTLEKDVKTELFWTIYEILHKKSRSIHQKYQKYN